MAALTSGWEKKDEIRRDGEGKGKCSGEEIIFVWSKVQKLKQNKNYLVFIIEMEFSSDILGEWMLRKWKWCEDVVVVKKGVENNHFQPFDSLPPHIQPSLNGTSSY